MKISCLPVSHDDLNMVLGGGRDVVVAWMNVKLAHVHMGKSSELTEVLERYRAGNYGLLEI